MGRFNILNGICVLAFALAPCVGHAAEGAEGVWRTADGHGLVEIRSCREELCGYEIDKATAYSTDAPPEGAPLLEGFRGGPVNWDSGRIHDPRNGRTYVGSLHLLEPTHLRIVGCLVRPLCGAQEWRRVR